MVVKSPISDKNNKENIVFGDDKVKILELSDS